MLSVNIMDEDGSVVGSFGEEGTDPVAYVSLVSSGTYGPPALIAPSRKKGEDDPRAQLGEEVLYINTALVPMFSIKRVSE